MPLGHRAPNGLCVHGGGPLAQRLLGWRWFSAASVFAVAKYVVVVCLASRASGFAQVPASSVIVVTVYAPCICSVSLASGFVQSSKGPVVKVAMHVATAPSVMEGIEGRFCVEASVVHVHGRRTPPAILRYHGLPVQVCVQWCIADCASLPQRSNCKEGGGSFLIP